MCRFNLFVLLIVVSCLALLPSSYCLSNDYDDNEFSSISADQDNLDFSSLIDSDITETASSLLSDVEDSSSSMADVDSDSDDDADDFDNNSDDLGAIESTLSYEKNHAKPKSVISSTGVQGAKGRPDFGKIRRSSFLPHTLVIDPKNRPPQDAVLKAPTTPIPPTTIPDLSNSLDPVKRGSIKPKPGMAYAAVCGSGMWSGC